MAGEACCSCEEVKSILNEFADNLRTLLEAQGKKPRKKRALSAYNLFIKECTTGGANDMRTCATKYKSLPEQEKAKYKESAKIQASTG